MGVKDDKLRILKRLQTGAINPWEVQFDGLTTQELWDLLHSLDKEKLVWLSKTSAELSPDGRLYLKEQSENQNPVTERNQIATDLLKFLGNSKTLVIREDETPINTAAIKELLNKDLIERDGAFYSITERGTAVLETGLPYPESLKQISTSNSSFSTHNITVSNGNVIIGNGNKTVSGSREKETQLPSKPKVHYMQWVAWICAIIGVLFTGYKLFFEKVTITKPDIQVCDISATMKGDTTNMRSAICSTVGVAKNAKINYVTVIRDGDNLQMLKGSDLHPPETLSNFGFSFETTYVSDVKLYSKPIIYLYIYGNFDDESGAYYDLHSLRSFRFDNPGTYIPTPKEYDWIMAFIKVNLNTN